MYVSTACARRVRPAGHEMPIGALRRKRIRSVTCRDRLDHINKSTCSLGTPARLPVGPVSVPGKIRGAESGRASGIDQICSSVVTCGAVP